MNYLAIYSPCGLCIGLAPPTAGNTNDCTSVMGLKSERVCHQQMLMSLSSQIGLRNIYNFKIWWIIINDSVIKLMLWHLKQDFPFLVIDPKKTCWRAWKIPLSATGLQKSKEIPKITEDNLQNDKEKYLICFCLL